MTRGPGITKIRCLWPVAVKQKTLYRATLPLLNEWLGHADIVSEGAVETSAAGASYFGSTHLRLPWAHSPHPALRDQRALLVLESDPHLRVLILRVARREAETRCRGTLHVMRADLSFSTDPVGFIALTDVDARVALVDASALHS
jgi:hypothetical protein